jgi:dethiobiotin synthetase
LRPERVVVLAGTGTEIGKTWVGAAMARELRAAGRTVVARKPAQSYDPADPHPTDAEVLAAATGEDPEQVCRPALSYPVALAPPMAADALGRGPLTLAALVEAITWPKPTVAVGLVELAGGVRSPMAVDGDGVDLVRAIGPDVVVLVADAGLGTINAVRLSAAALEPTPVVVHLNRYDDGDDVHRLNRDWLADHDAVTLTTTTTALLSRLELM